jgi:uncharacterized protein YkwD
MSALEMTRALALIALLLAVTGWIAGQAGAVGTGSTATERLQVLEFDILARLNAVRASHDLRPLSLSGDLRSAAVSHSQSMVADGYFKHESRDGSAFSIRVKQYYPAAGFAHWSVGENLLYTTGDPDAPGLVQAWLNSPSHRRNILSPAWREVGIGAIQANSAGGEFGGARTLVVTMDFGTRSSDAAR